MRELTLALFILLVLIFPLSKAEIDLPKVNFSLKVTENDHFILVGSTNMEGKIKAIHVDVESLPIDPNYFYYLAVKYPELFRTIRNMLGPNFTVQPLFIKDLVTDDLRKIYITNPSTQEVRVFDDAKLRLLGSKNALCGSSMILDFNNKLDCAILTMLNSSKFLQEIKIPLVVLLTEDRLKVIFKNSSAYMILPFSIISGEEKGTGRIIIENKNGGILLNDSAANWIAIIEDSNLYLDMESPIVIIPSSKDLTINIKELEGEHDLERLAKEVASMLGNSFNISSFPSFLSNFTNVLSGSFLSIGTNSSVDIRGKTYDFKDFGLIRFWSCSFTPTGSTAELKGKGKFFFLGDYVYNEIPTYNFGGISIPVQLIEIWALCIGIFIIFYFVLRKGKKIEGKKEGVLRKFPLEFSERIKRMVKWSALAMHIIVIIFVFLAFDAGFYHLIGISAFSSKNLFVFLPLFSFQLLCMGIAYIFFSLPVRIASYGVLEWIGIAKEGKGFGKGIGLLIMVPLGLSYISFLLNGFVFLVREVISNMLGSFPG